MKTAFSSFIYSRKGIYGILHVLILCLSLFLIISISMDTFHNIPFINQGSYLRIQFWICMFFLFLSSTYKCNFLGADNKQ